jgi:hypothetical protein
LRAQKIYNQILETSSMDSNSNRTNTIGQFVFSLIGIAVFIYGIIVRTRNSNIVFLLPTILGFSLFFLFSSLIELYGHDMWQSVKIGTYLFALIGLAITIGCLFRHFFPTMAAIQALWGFFTFLICFTGLLCAASIKTLINLYKSLMRGN